MTSSLDGESYRTDTLSGLDSRMGLHADDLACGGDIDWSNGIESVAPFAGSSTAVSGALLAKVIEGQIIPRLLLAHRGPDMPSEAPSPNQAIEPVLDSETFARLVLISEPAEIISQIEALMAQGVRLERIYLDLLSPVARLLGVLWNEDRCTFADVTLGLSRLHQVLHEIGRRHVSGSVRMASPRRILLVPVPGEQHTFGLSILQEFFQNAGWQIAIDHAPTAASIEGMVSSEHLDVVGISLGCVEYLDPLTDLIKRTRAASRNRDIVIMVGGRLFADFPEHALKLQGQAIVTDGVHAVGTAERIVAEQLRSGEAARLM